MPQPTITDIKIAAATGRIEAARDYATSTLYSNSEPFIKLPHQDTSNLTLEQSIENDAYLLEAGQRIQDRRLSRS